MKAGLTLAVVSMVFNMMSTLIEFGFETTMNPVAVVLFVIAFIVFTLVSVYISIVLNNMGVVQFYLRAHENVETLKVKDLWAPHPFLKYILTSVLVGLAFIVGLVFLIVPGIIIALAFGMALYLVMDRNMDAIPAIKESIRITRGNRWRLFLLYVFMLLINIIGLLVLVVGLLVTIPVTMLAGVHAYRMLSRGSEPAAVV